MRGSSIDKHVLARNFTAAAAGYDARATAQALIARGLGDRLPARLAPGLAVDLGCGTGLSSELLLERFPDARLVGLDLAESMVNVCRRRWGGTDRAEFVVGDAEDPAQLRTPAALVACSCSAQWFDRPADTLGMWAAALAPGGVLAWAVLTQGSFVELETAYREAFRADFPGLRLWDARTGPAILARAGLDRLCLDQQSVTVCYDSPRAALRSFRQTGATLDAQQGHRRLGPALARRLLDCYDRLDARHAAVTYRVQYLIGRKPG
jgi:malonyl-CoA O-methyltransferase